MDPIATAREEYRGDVLTEETVDPDPLVQLRRWLEQAFAAELSEPNAATLATVDRDGWPDARIMLVRGVDERGVSFYTDRRSAKAAQLEAHPVATLVWHWQPLYRQVRLRGPVEPVPDEESEDYFASRPRASQVGTWASDQSAPIADRAALEAQVAELESRFAEGEVPCPPHWVGYRVRAEEVEFWQGRPARLHDRLRFRRDGDGWALERLQP